MACQRACEPNLPGCRAGVLRPELSPSSLGVGRNILPPYDWPQLFTKEHLTMEDAAKRPTSRERRPEERKVVSCPRKRGGPAYIRAENIQDRQKREDGDMLTLKFGKR